MIDTSRGPTSGGLHSRVAAMRSAGRRDDTKPTVETNAFGIGAEKAFNSADAAISSMSKVADLLKVAAKQQMAYAKTAAKDIQSMALKEMGYSEADRAEAEQQMQRADAEYAQYDEEYRARQAEYDKLWKPVEERTAELAMTASKFDEGVVGRAGADAAQASASADAQARHEMAQMGVSAESGRYGDWSKRRASANAMLEATLKNQARTTERNRVLTTGLSSAQSALGTGFNIKQGDLASKEYQLSHANTLYGLSNQNKVMSSAGRGRAADLTKNSAQVGLQGMQGLEAAANAQGNVARAATGLAGIYGPLSIEKAKVDATPSIGEAMNQRVSAMNSIDDKLTAEGRSYPWSFVVGGSN